MTISLLLIFVAKFQSRRLNFRTFEKTYYHISSSPIFQLLKHGFATKIKITVLTVAYYFCAQPSFPLARSQSLDFQQQQYQYGNYYGAAGGYGNPYATTYSAAAGYGAGYGTGYGYGTTGYGTGGYGYGGGTGYGGYGYSSGYGANSYQCLVLGICYGL